MATFVYASSRGQHTHSARTNSKIFTPHICSPLLGEKYPDYFVLPAPPNYSARTSLGPIKKSYECYFPSCIIFVISNQHYAISCPKKAEHPGQIYGLKVFSTLEEHLMKSCGDVIMLYLLKSCNNLFITAPLVKRGRDQHVAIIHLLLLLRHPPPSSIGPIRAKQIARCSSLIGRQY